MKKTLLISAALILCATIWAQVPQGISHQAVIRNTQGELVTNQFIGIQVSIIEDSINGKPVYRETHTATTNVHGLVTYVIGEGDPREGSFDEIKWDNWPYFLMTEVDPDYDGDEFNFTITGTTQFLSVPYALYSGTSADNHWLKEGDNIFSRNTGNVGIGTQTPFSLLHTLGNGTGEGNVLFEGVYKTAANQGDPPTAGPGTRMMWYPDRAAFRAGRVVETHWDKDSIGIYSFATGINTVAKEQASTAMGSNTTASGFISTAMGSGTTASGIVTTAMGAITIASGSYSTAMGFGTTASGFLSTAMGSSTTASGDASTAMGEFTFSEGDYSTAMGWNSRAIGDYSFAINLSDFAGPDVPANTFHISGAANTIISNGNVGIGTLSPGQLLDVNGNIRLSGGDRSLGTWSAHNLGLTTNSSTRMTITSAGNIGIGILTPEAQLHTTGSVRFEGAGSPGVGKVLTSDGIGNASWQNESDPTWSGAANTTDDIYRTGNVGIGTSTPGQLLDVNGNIRLSGGNRSLGTWSANNLDLTTNSNARMTITSEGNVGIGTTSPTALLHTNGTGVGEGNVLFVGSYKSTNPGDPPAQGFGTRMMWYPDKAAFRVGQVTGYQWNKDFIGLWSFASGYDAIASGNFSISVGANTSALGDYSIAMGAAAWANAQHSIGMGAGAWASANYSIAMGYQAYALSSYATAMGRETRAWGNSSTAIGRATEASGNSSTAMGIATEAEADYSTAMGRQTIASGINSTAMGYQTIASGNYSTAMGMRSRAVGTNSFAINLDIYEGPNVGSREFHISGAEKIGGNKGWSFLSDKRMKKDVQFLENENSLEKIMKLQGVRFRWNESNPDAAGRYYLGFLAQDVLEVLPEPVLYDELNDKYSMEYTAIIPVLVEGIKEQQAIIEMLIKRIEALEAEKTANVKSGF